VKVREKNAANNSYSRKPSPDVVQDSHNLIIIRVSCIKSLSILAFEGFAKRFRPFLDQRSFTILFRSVYKVLEHHFQALLTAFCRTLQRDELTIQSGM